MSDVLAQLLDLLKLEAIGVNRFRGHSQDLGFRNLFGGQVLGQSISAAMQTLNSGHGHASGKSDNRDSGGWHAHSLHAYFLRAGNVTDSIEFEVEILRDGRSFASRQVKASQNGKAILTMMASFQLGEDGFDHQQPMPEVKGPGGIPSQLELTRMFRDHFPERVRDIYTADKPIEIRVLDPVNIFAPDKREAVKFAWMKADAPMGDNPDEHARVLAYASDFNLITTALQPHGVSVAQREMQVASLDHSIWFHRPLRMDEWLLYAIDSPSAYGSRGFCRGQIFNQAGELVASVAQEGLMRQRTDAVSKKGSDSK